LQTTLKKTTKEDTKKGKFKFTDSPGATQIPSIKKKNQKNEKMKSVTSPRKIIKLSIDKIKDKKEDKDDKNEKNDPQQLRARSKSVVSTSPISQARKESARLKREEKIAAENTAEITTEKTPEKTSERTNEKEQQQQHSAKLIHSRSKSDLGEKLKERIKEPTDKPTAAFPRFKIAQETARRRARSVRLETQFPRGKKEDRVSITEKIVDSKTELDLKGSPEKKFTLLTQVQQWK